ncbi:DUF937 domain-containing protein [Luteimonas marina]|uniref:DUF937 domain-containing protein n=1 Tax=Luteimonas marina TaxID=488485 RepID=A0A5C5U2F8_9GAMM|nr:DUF937 domain-containing protein [Luteimonas marina]TWT19958.1 DUF937 domain-containing protein [Luteimonas marina]
MASSLTDQLFEQLSGAPLQQISSQLGVGQAQAAGAVSAALPLLLGALGRNASQPQGAQALFGALQNDFAGADLGNILGAVLGGGGGASSRQTNGAGILGHVFGGQQPRAEASLGQATGLGSDKAGQLMKILAPIVLAFLAKQMFQNKGAGAPAQQQDPTAQLLGSILGREQQQVRQQGGIGGGLLGAVLDQDGDGQLGLGDILKIGGGLLGGKR